MSSAAFEFYGKKMNYNKQTVRVEISQTVKERIFSTISHSDIEEGGKLLGKVVQNGSDILIQALSYIDSGPRVDNSMGHLHPDGEYQENVFRLVEIFDPDVDHVGSWHSHHCNGLDELSGGDISGYKKSVNNHQYNLDYFFVILVFGINRSDLKAKYYLFCRGQDSYYSIKNEDVRYIRDEYHYENLLNLAEETSWKERKSPKLKDRAAMTKKSFLKNDFSNLLKAIRGQDKVWFERKFPFAKVFQNAKSRAIGWKWKVPYNGENFAVRYTYPQSLGDDEMGWALLEICYDKKKLLNEQIPLNDTRFELIEKYIEGSKNRLHHARTNQNNIDKPALTEDEISTLVDKVASQLDKRILNEKILSDQKKEMELNQRQIDIQKKEKEINEKYNQVEKFFNIREIEALKREKVFQKKGIELSQREIFVSELEHKISEKEKEIQDKVAELGEKDRALEIKEIEIDEKDKNEEQAELEKPKKYNLTILKSVLKYVFVLAFVYLFIFYLIGTRKDTDYNHTDSEVQNIISQSDRYLKEKNYNESTHDTLTNRVIKVLGKKELPTSQRESLRKILNSLNFQESVNSLDVLINQEKFDKAVEKIDSIRKRMGNYISDDQNNILNKKINAIRDRKKHTDDNSPTVTPGKVEAKSEKEIKSSKVDQFLLEANEYLKGKTFDWKTNKHLLDKVSELKNDPKIELEQNNKIKEVSVKINDIYVEYYMVYTDKLVERTQFKDALGNLNYLKDKTPYLRPIHKEKLDEKINTIGKIRLTKKEHKVRKGETLNSISKKYKVSIDELVRLNGIEDSNAELKKGDIIIIR